MKKIFIIISVIFTGIVLLAVLFVAGLFVWDYFSEKRQNNDDCQSYISMPDDEDDDTPHSEFLPENRVRLNDRLLSLTAREGMNSGYDDLCEAIVFASEALDYSSFPVLPFGYGFSENPEQRDEHIAAYVKWGDGMHTLRRLISYAYQYKSNDLTGVDKLVQRFGRLVQTLFPRQKYVANGWERLVNQLLVAYDDLSVNPENFRKVYHIMNAGLDFPHECYKEILPMIRDQQLTAFISDRNIDFLATRGLVNHFSVAWAYSFWGRRHDENPDNILPIASALKVLRDELYAPDAPTPDLDREHPPIEPYLASKLRPGEPIYPWKMYTNRVEFVSADYNNPLYNLINVSHNGAEICLYDATPDELNFESGSIIEITWYHGTFLSYGDFGTQMSFLEHAHSVKLVK